MPSVDTSTPDRPQLRVFLAEDDDDIRLYMSIILQRAGFLVDEHDNGSDALSAAQRSPADIYVVDRRMPGMDGAELCRQLRAHPLTRAARIVLTSAQTTDLPGVAAAAGADEYLTKPFSPEELIEKVAPCIDATTETPGSEQGGGAARR